MRLAKKTMPPSVWLIAYLTTVAADQPSMWVMTPFLVAATEVTTNVERENIICSLPTYGDKA